MGSKHDTIQPHRRTLVLGVTGAGKSHHVRGLVSRVAQSGGSVLVVDPKGEYSDLSPCSPLDLVPRLLAGDDLRLRTSPQWQSLDSLAEDVSLVLDSLRWRPPTARPMLVVVEECGLLRGPARSSLEVLATVGRSYGVELVCVAQRASQIPATVRAQASRIVAFRQTLPADLEALAEVMGPSALDLRTLARYEFRAWSEGDAWSA